MAEKLYFGVLENIQEIPAPKSGMGFRSETDTEVTELVSGGRSVYRAPTAFKSFNMTWATTADRLRHIISMYNGQFGTGPFYLTDPTVDQENVLPARWSNGWQLAHQAGGWCRPMVRTTVTPLPSDASPTRYHTNRYAEFTQVAAGSSVPLEGVVKTRLIRVPGKAYYFMVDGAATGGAGIKVRGYNGTTGVWTTLHTVTIMNSVYTIVAADNTTTTMIELDLYMPLGSSLQIYGMVMSTEDLFEIQDVQRTNLLGDPAPASASTFAHSGGSGAWTHNTSESQPFARFTKDATTAAVAISWGSAMTAPVGSTFSFRFWVRPSYGATITLRNNATAFTINPTRVLTANQWNEVVYEGHVTTVANFRLTFLVSSMTAASTWDLKQGIVEQAETSPNYFTGATPDDPARDLYYRWTGPANSSPSVQTSSVPTDWMPVGTGIGPVNFASSTDAELVSSTIDRIGLSLDFIEVESVEG